VTRHSSLATHHSSLALLPLCAAVCLFAGCAAEAPPRPPRVQIPVKVADLAATQSGQTIRLAFDIPRLTVDRRRLTKPVGAEIFRQIFLPGEAPSRGFAGKPWISLSPSALARIKRGSTASYEERLSKQAFAREVGAQFAFMVITLTRGFRGRARKSSPSNIARIKLLDVSPPIDGLRAIPTPRGPHLQWSPPARSLAGGPLSPISSYRVYRSTNNAQGPYLLLAQTVRPEYNDSDVQFNASYFYRVSAAFAQQGFTATSADSLPVGITPRDVFPPPVPAGLATVWTGRQVQLIWKADDSPNLAGYNVYRQQGSGPVERLNPKLLLAPAFGDATTRPDRHYVYWVTAVSLTHHESQPSAKVAADTGQ
jgi:hypothetical protein